MMDRNLFELHSNKTPAGDQPRAIQSLIDGIKSDQKDQVLLGITGSGKTFTVANVIASLKRPSLIMVHNKTLAAQLYAEMKELFPTSAVEYFVSYYDYYQPEAYMAKTDTYIEKDSVVNEQLDLLRHSAIINLLERRDTIIISSVSSIYGIGNKEHYTSMRREIFVGQKVPMEVLLDDFIKLQYERNDMSLERGFFTVKGDVIELFPCHLENIAWRMEFHGSTIETITEFNALTREKLNKPERIILYPNKLFATPIDAIVKATKHIKHDMELEVESMRKIGKDFEAKRLEQRTLYDIEMLTATGMCKGIENYSRYLDGRKPGDAPSTMFAYLPKDALLFIDESHITVPQIGAMYEGDRSRKTNLVDHGFRLLSALDNRPLKFEEWDTFRPQTIFVSATPANFEITKSNGVVVEQIIRPTGLLDPICEIRGVESQIDDFLAEAKKVIVHGGRILALTLTKKMAERLSDFLLEHKFKSAYLHSEIKTFERVEILNSLRSGAIDIIVGINLLREGLDIPECELVAIFDADKEGFLRNETSLIQIIGRAARNIHGRVILYADKMTKSIDRALSETKRRREIQEEHNSKNGITPMTVKKDIMTVFDVIFANNESRSMSNLQIENLHKMTEKQQNRLVLDLKKKMKKAAKEWNFEEAEKIRLEIKKVEAFMLNG